MGVSVKIAEIELLNDVKSILHTKKWKEADMKVIKSFEEFVDNLKEQKDGERKQSRKRYYELRQKKDPEYMKEYREKNKEKLQEYYREYYKNVTKKKRQKNKSDE